MDILTYDPLLLAICGKINSYGRQNVVLSTRDFSQLVKTSWRITKMDESIDSYADVEKALLLYFVNNELIYIYGDELSYFRIVRVRGNISLTESLTNPDMSGVSLYDIRKNNQENTIILTQGAEFPIDNFGRVVLTGQVTLDKILHFYRYGNLLSYQISKVFDNYVVNVIDKSKNKYFALMDITDYYIFKELVD